MRCYAFLSDESLFTKKCVATHNWFKTLKRLYTPRNSLVTVVLSRNYYCKAKG